MVVKLGRVSHEATQHSDVAMTIPRPDEILDPAAPLTAPFSKKDVEGGAALVQMRHGSRCTAPVTPNPPAPVPWTNASAFRAGEDGHVSRHSRGFKRLYDISYRG